MTYILLIDDDPYYLSSMKTFLEGLDKITVDICSDPRKAVAMGVQRLPCLDIILLDLVMPQMDGASVAAQIRQHPELAAVPIIFLTGSTKEIVTHGELPDGYGVIGGERYILKGIPLEQLAKIVERVILKERAKTI
jgi:CheY-like chemotaxis protein